MPTSTSTSIIVNIDIDWPVPTNIRTTTKKVNKMMYAWKRGNQMMYAWRKGNEMMFAQKKKTAETKTSVRRNKARFVSSTTSAVSMFWISGSF